MFSESQSSKIVCLGLFVVFGLVIHTSSAKPLTERSRLPFEDCGKYCLLVSSLEKKMKT